MFVDRVGSVSAILQVKCSVMWYESVESLAPRSWFRTVTLAHVAVSLESVTTSAAGTLPAPNTVCSSTTEDWSVGQTARRDQKEASKRRPSLFARVLRGTRPRSSTEDYTARGVCAGQAFAHDAYQKGQRLQTGGRGLGCAWLGLARLG